MKSFLHSSWITDFSSNKNGSAIPRGVYAELRTLRSPCLVNGFLGICNWKPNVSFSICQTIPKALSWGISPDERSWYFASSFFFHQVCSVELLFCSL